MTYEHISREHGIAIRVGDPVRHKEMGLDGEILAPGPYYPGLVRVRWPDCITSEVPTDLLYLDLPVTAQLPEIGGEAA
jgi:hypothetical protein